MLNSGICWEGGGCFIKVSRPDILWLILIKNSIALSCLVNYSLLSQGDSLYLGGVVAVVDPDKCVGCLTCTRTCPFGIPKVIQEEGRHGVGDLGGAAFIDTAQCQGCGTCTGECPANAIQLVNYSDEQIMLRGIHGLGSWVSEGIPAAD